MKAVQPHVPFSLGPLPVNFLIGVKLMSHLTNKELELNVGKGNWLQFQCLMYTFLNARCRMILYPTIIFYMYCRVGVGTDFFKVDIYVIKVESTGR